MHAIALELLYEYGDQGVLETITYGDYDPALGARSETKVSTNVWYVQENYTTYSPDTGVSAGGDLKITTAVGSGDVSENDFIVLYTGTKCNIISCSPVSTQSGIVIYELQARAQV